jgi:MacB-like periplasmic core domain/FtsX-like permease family
VIGYELWQRRFGGAQDVLGKQVRIEGQPFTIVGVTRKWFTGLTPGEPPDVTIPITSYPALHGNVDLEDRSVLWLRITGRLKGGVTIDQARAQLRSFWPEVLLATTSTETPGLRRQTFLSMGLDVSPVRTGFARDLRAQFSRPLYVLAGIVALILLVACANLANLMLARAAARGQEMSVRVAIGASRGALAGQVLTENLLLSLVGALFGLILSNWGSRVLVAFMTEGTVSLDLRPDLRVLSLALFVGVLTGILFGLAPTREIGVRVALGAQQGRVRWMILRETFALTLFGIAIGIPAGLAASRLIASMLFGLSPSDLSTIVTACLLLLAVAFFAGYLPARKASCVDPVVALRTE